MVARASKSRNRYEASDDKMQQPKSVKPIASFSIYGDVFQGGGQLARASFGCSDVY